MANSNHDDDFLAQVQTTEAKAEDLEQKALDKQEKDLATHREKTKKTREKFITDQRDVMKKELADSTAKARMQYEKETKKGQIVAEDMRQSKLGMFGNVVKKSAENFVTLVSS